eukprot:TRINITY_DN577_c0_g1_i14.p2 TRINITY_DN577_c0_g1~~TRINITY_DN577_c0_g1_i14.p2  ORF type:complete len:111 (-),score=7.61 TRINITY_DN577_c0_g1_i14:130-462(-)
MVGPLVGGSFKDRQKMLQANSLSMFCTFRVLSGETIHHHALYLFLLRQLYYHCKPHHVDLSRLLQTSPRSISYQLKESGALHNSGVHVITDGHNMDVAVDGQNRNTYSDL